MGPPGFLLKGKHFSIIWGPPLFLNIQFCLKYLSQKLIRQLHWKSLLIRLWNHHGNWRSDEHCQSKAGSTVAVFGLGGVGLGAIQGAAHAQAERIIAVDINPDKENFARQMGATDFSTPKIMISRSKKF